MKKILILIATFMFAAGNADAAVRDGNIGSRGGGAVTTNAQRRVSTTAKPDRSVSPRTTVLSAPRTVKNSSTAARTTTSRSQTTSSRDVVSRTANTTTARSTSTRAATNTLTSETRTGAQYETCKTAYFTCMDQFCALKDDDYRRCSCSNRIDSLVASRNVLTSAGEQLTIFTENLDTVGMTAAQATAMHTASDGENALTSDTSASKALLQAIMNSIRGGDATVGGKYSDLNSINMSFDTSAVFGDSDGQIISSYNGQSLYTAVYPQCRNAVRDDCNNASLQRAVTAYLMAIEQDCNTVQTAIEQKQKEMKSAIREGSAMLDLARIENRRKHNSDDITTCINNVESAILSEEVCGANYHKCLDNGEFIDISTGAPITGVIEFYKLGELLTFKPGVDAAAQRLSKSSNNRTFVNNFEKRTKKFAKPALDKCVDIADEVWAEYLDKAMLSIYYAQQSKVAEIKQGCFDFVSRCYESSDTSITLAMSQLMGDAGIILQPDKVTLSTQLCRDYVDSCNNMFGGSGAGDIIAEYVENRESTDVLAACRAVVKQCFDKYGGTGYENFFYPYSGLFSTATAPDWFTLYDYTDGSGIGTLKSPCAQQLANIPSCADVVQEAFGGFDKFKGMAKLDDDENPTKIIVTVDTSNQSDYYGLLANNSSTPNNDAEIRHRELRSLGVATEVYNQIIDTLTTQCTNIRGRFMEIQFLQKSIYNDENYCLLNMSTEDEESSYSDLIEAYGINENENICPRDYALNVDTQSWGACSCWGNGGRRSKNGRAATCMNILPGSPNDAYCEFSEPQPEDSENQSSEGENQSGEGENQSGEEENQEQQSEETTSTNTTDWCVQVTDGNNRVCPIGFTNQYIASTDTYMCKGNQSDEESEETDSSLPDYFSLVPAGL